MDKIVDTPKYWRYIGSERYRVIVQSCWYEHDGIYANVGIDNGKSIRYRKMFIEGDKISYPGYVYPYVSLSGEMDDSQYESFLSEYWSEIIDLISSLLD
jgi:hypothetical protein